jgi:hypothetical protein
MGKHFIIGPISLFWSWYVSTFRPFQFPEFGHTLLFPRGLFWAFSAVQMTHLPFDIVGPSQVLLHFEPEMLTFRTF